MFPIPFGLIGSGWRAEFYLRAAGACPEKFAALGVVVRNEEKARAFERRFGVRAFPTVDALLAERAPRFVVTSVPWDANDVLMLELAEKGMPVLSETPPAPDLPRMRTLCARLARANAKVQVAEQVHLRPHHQAQLAVAASGRLGKLSQAQVSVAHGYHGISLMRKFLGVRFEPCTVTASGFQSPLVQGPGRRGPPEEEHLVESQQLFARFDFSDRLGWLDFASHQYFSAIRGERLLVRGERGELDCREARWLKDPRTPLRLEFVRHQTGADGDLNPPCLQGIQFGEDWLYRNAYAPARLMDDEIAVAECLSRMDEYVRTGREFYSVPEACQDHYLGLLADQALKSGAPAKSEPQAWA